MFPERERNRSIRSERHRLVGFHVFRGEIRAELERLIQRDLEISAAAVIAHDEDRAAGLAHDKRRTLRSSDAQWKILVPIVPRSCGRGAVAEIEQADEVRVVVGAGVVRRVRFDLVRERHAGVGALGPTPGLSFTAGPGGSVLMPVRVDWEAWPQLLLDREGTMDNMLSSWMDEDAANVCPVPPMPVSFADDKNHIKTDIIQNVEHFRQRLSIVHGRDLRCRRARF
jgi:hypothetical protein